MLSGINIDIEYEGTIYHVQTEDSGLSSPVVVTTVFKNGAILKTRKTSYAEIVKSKELKAVLKEMMTLQHKETIEAPGGNLVFPFLFNLFDQRSHSARRLLKLPNCPLMQVFVLSHGSQ